MKNYLKIIKTILMIIINNYYKQHQSCYYVHYKYKNFIR